MHRSLLVLALIGVLAMTACSSSDGQAEGAARAARIVFLHHSTGNVVWVGNTSKIMARVLGKSDVKAWFSAYNDANGTSHEIEAIDFPTGKDYEWANYPYDYYNIWVKHAGDSPYRGEPTLEMLTKRYDVIVWKQCFPGAAILPDTGTPDIGSSEKRLENYKLQYQALKEKMRSFPRTKFIVWTAAALTKSSTTPEQAQRAKEFVDWVRSEWDEPGDNIFVWDFYQLETEGGLYLKDEYAQAKDDSHPTPAFGGRVAPLFAQRIVDVIGGKGDSTQLTGEKRAQ